VERHRRRRTDLINTFSGILRKEERRREGGRSKDGRKSEEKKEGKDRKVRQKAA
jgi:hypothetical protein